jgi:PAS domain S-box-containing protein
MSDVDGAESTRSTITAAQWRQIVNGATDTAIISTDDQGRVTGWNTGASRILGWSESEMLGQSLSRIFPDDEQEFLRQEIEDATAHGKGGGEEGWRVRKDGSHFWAVGELSPILEDETIVGFVKILRDRTNQRQTEESCARNAGRWRFLTALGPLLPLKPISNVWSKSLPMPESS